MMTVLIGEVSQHSGISTRMLRHYDSLGLVSPSGRTSGGYREYTAADISRLFQVECLRSLGLSLRELKDALDDSSVDPAALVSELIAHTQDRIAQQEELLRRLRHVADTEPDDWTAVLNTVSIMRGLESALPSSRQRSALSASNARLSERLLAEALLDETNANVAGALQWALQRSSGEAITILGSALGSPEPVIRRRAVAALAKLATEESASLLIGALDNTDSIVREQAALALGRRGDVRVASILLNMIVSGAHDVEAAETLGSLAVEHHLVDDIASHIVEVLDDEETTSNARLRLAQSLAEFPGGVAHRALVALKSDADQPIALTAAFLVERFGI